MSLRKRGDTYHTRFTVHDKRYEVSLHTSDKREAYNLEKQLIADAHAGKLSASHQPFAKLPLIEAMAQLINDPLWAIKESSRMSYRRSVSVLRLFPELAAKPVHKVSVEDLRTFMRKRLETVAHATLNVDLCAIRQTLRRAKLWHKFSEDIKALPPNNERTGWAMSPEETIHLIETAWSEERWHPIAAILEFALNTGMRCCELKKLRWQDIHTEGGVSWLEVLKASAKTKDSERFVELNTTARRILSERLVTSQRLGGGAPEHYVFCVDTRPSSPRSSWRGVFIAIRKKAAAKFPNLAKLRFHDLRHTVISKVAKNANLSVTSGKELVGHSERDDETWDRYSHGHRRDRLAVVDAIDTRHLRETAELERMVGVEPEEASHA